VLDCFHRFTDLVDGSAFVIRPRTPLVTVDMPQISILIGPFIPDAYPVLLQVFYVCIAFQEPEQFVDNGFQMKFLGSQTREALVHIETHLVSEYADCTGSGAVAFFYAFSQYTVE
jgi:hypothetical protein